jgi:adenylate cyclase
MRFILNCQSDNAVMFVILKAILFGICISLWGIAMCLSPWGTQLEEDFGLSLLFRLRGIAAPPPEVVIIGMDQASARQLELQHKPRFWPRSLHTQLVRQLTEAKVKLIAFDIIFDEPRDAEGDEAFAAAIAAAGNVLLVEIIRKEKILIADGASQLEIERLTQPIEPLKTAALALAPFPIPKVPIKVSQYWTFKTGAGSIPAFPVVAFQIFALDVYEDLIAHLSANGMTLPADMPKGEEEVRQNGRMEGVVRSIRELFQAAPTRIQPPPITSMVSLRPSGETEARLRQRLYEMYAAPESHYLNFYGPPGSILTIPYHKVINAEEGRLTVKALPELAGKAVFIGLSERDVPIKSDGFYTTFSQPDGIDLNGVEIAATAFANILENRPIRPVPASVQLAVVGVCGVVFGLVSRLIPNPGAGGAMLVLGLLYLWMSKYYFSDRCLWLPVVVVVFGQLPVALIGGVIWQYVDVDKERKAILHAFRFYLPCEMVDQIAADKAPITAEGRMIYGTFLCTDLAKYTNFSEKTDPAHLHRLMHEYYDAMFQALRKNGGFVSDISGDCMMGLWASQEPQPTHLRQACEAALQIEAALTKFWKASGPDLYLPTRMGIHCGPVHIGNVGADTRYVFQATGDTVNTASRIENLNKHLGTRILVTGDALDGAGPFLTRQLGTFYLSGKTKSVDVHELVCRLEQASGKQRDLCARFTQGLAAFKLGAWEEAMQIFNRLVTATDGDGPARFYLDICRRYLKTPPSDAWAGAVTVSKK